MEKQPQWQIGIDEAGRGPLAGPVAVGVVLVPGDFDWGLLPGVGDSKAISEKKREIIYKEAMVLAKTGKLICTVEMASAKAIDKRGISLAIRECIDKGLKSVLAEAKDVSSRKDLELNKSQPKSSQSSSRSFLELDWGMVEVKLDGSLKAPDYCVHQETIIKGDAKEKVIGLASILAKVTRDSYMRRVALRPAFAPYYFSQHKGYGTASHRRAIAEHGLSPEHRASYCKNIVML
ncbi:MAG: ribonuclease HII [Candidatus Paceibacteria bacterium]